MAFHRTSGVLLHPTCLPSRFGIGDLGRSAYEFVDFLERSGQHLWQVLPLGPTGYEHSPYTMNFSAFAGNPLLISLDLLAAEGLLNPDALTPLEGDGIGGDRVNFDRVIAHKMPYLHEAHTQFKQRLADDSHDHAHHAEHSDEHYHEHHHEHHHEQRPLAGAELRQKLEQFCQEQAGWLADYVLFMALLEAHQYQPWNTWEAAIARREPEALATQREHLKEAIDLHNFLQFKFFEQWSNLRAYANSKHIQIVGDVSIYVCHNSADVWAHPESFKLDRATLESAYIAGVPPDYFSETGQLWGNPVYDWEQLQRSNYQWWIDRFKATLQYVDIVRIDHFRGFEAYWQVPGGEKTAMNGQWVKGPDADFFEKLREAIGSLPVMAEDLGVITPEVEALRDRFDFPGMKILQFAFSGDPDNAYLPHHYGWNCVVYPGTHDNDTAIGWWQQAKPEEKQQVANYLGFEHPEQIQEISWELIRLALSSIADLSILPLQDILSLDGSARMNDPSINDGQWRWRLDSGDRLTQEVSDRLLHLTRLYRR